MSNKLQNYLRTYRRRAGLTQNQVAFLLGFKSGARISRYEHFHRLPDLRTAFGLEVIFHATARELFAGPYEEVEYEIEKRARLLADTLERNAALTARRSPASRGTMKPRG